MPYGPGARIKKNLFWFKIKKKIIQENFSEGSDCQIICQSDRGQGSTLNGYK